jgi:hypothetical protein
LHERLFWGKIRPIAGGFMNGKDCADTVEKAEFEGVTAAGADGREDIWNGAAPSGY